MRAKTSQYIDIHGELYPYDKVLSFFETVESEFDVLRYCSGANAAARWIFQVYNREGRKAVRVPQGPSGF